MNEVAAHLEEIEQAIWAVQMVIDKAILVGLVLLVLMIMWGD